MTNQARWILGIGMGLMAAAGAFLHHWQNLQRLGEPGVRVITGELRDTSGAGVATNLVYLPERVLSMTSTQLMVTSVEYNWLPADTTFGRRRYTDTNGFIADISVVLMGTDRTSIHQPQYCLTGQGWTIERSERLRIPIDRPEKYDLEVVRLLASFPQRLPDGTVRTWRGIYVYWFVADGQLTADHSQRMWWMARDLLLKGVLQRWAYISYLTICSPGQEAAAYAALEKMIQASVPEFQRATPGGTSSLRTAGKD
ncbi:MAG: exosortase-associated EpsI family protein [Pedosphaera parvula]|nr:exosortase-associated EpsI family protein [Pedosphaera parvula]